MVLGRGVVGQHGGHARPGRGDARQGEDGARHARGRSGGARPSARTLGDLVEPYLKERVTELSARSLYIYGLYLRDHWKPLHKKALRDITRHDVLPMLLEMARQSGEVTS